MKKLIPFLIITLLFSSCETKRNIEQEIQDEIKRFYEVTEVKNYQPISFSEFYLVPSTEYLNMDNKLIGLDAIINKGYELVSYNELTKLASKKSSTNIGYMIHTLKGQSNYGDENRYVNTFKIMVYNDKVLVIPQDY